MRPSIVAAPRLSLAAATAADLMTPNPVSISADATPRDALLLLHDRNFGAAPVIDGAGRPVGVISRSDLRKHAREAARGRAPREHNTRREPALASDEAPAADEDAVRVCDVMRGAVFAVAPDTPAASVVEQLQALKVRRLFVVGDDGVLVGVISITDVLSHLTA